MNTAADRFDLFLGKLTASLGHADRHQPCADYLTGLILPGDRKSMEPLAARVVDKPGKKTSAKHQTLQHFVSNAQWNGLAMLDAAREYAMPFMEKTGGVSAWIADDTGMAKKGKCSVGVAKQYCGSLGKVENCQCAVSLSLANEKMAFPVAYRLYLPKEWADDEARRKAVKVPEKVVFRTKPELVLDEIDRLLERNIPKAPFLADAGYGRYAAFREGLVQRGLIYAVGVMPEQGVKIVGRPVGKDKPLSAGKAKEIAQALPRDAWKVIRWRQGTRKAMKSRFAFLRVIPTLKAEGPTEGEQWLVIEWPEGEAAPTKYILSTLPKGMKAKEIVRIAKLRWHIERNYEELKGELGLDHFEGRSWLGFHHHGTLSITAFIFLATERVRSFSPGGEKTANLIFPEAKALPKTYRPRGSPAGKNRIRP